MGGKKHVTSACMNCRRRKVKCDGKETCSNCVGFKVPCIYNADADMRKVSAKRVIGQLRSRLAYLEDTLRERGMQQYVQPSGSEYQNILDLYDAKVSNNDDDEDTMVVDPALAAHMSANQSTTGDTAPASAPPPRKEASQAQSQASDTSPSGAAIGAPPQDDGNLRPATLTDDDERARDESVNSRPPTWTNRMINTYNDVQVDEEGEAAGTIVSEVPYGTDPYGAPHDPSDLDGENDSEDSIADRLATRVGALRIAEDGQLRYYGPTSNLHIQSSGAQSLSQGMIRQVATEGAGVLRRLGLDHHVPLDVQTHLAKLYFTWEDPAIHVIDEDVFFEERERWLLEDYSTPYYSETLNNAICAIGASLAVGENLGLPEPASEHFSAKAKALLDIEMDSPTIATVQALVIMSASEAASTRDTRGWLYSGLAAKLSADLGLHLDVTRHRNSGLLTQRDLEIRKTTFWGVFIHENMWCLYVGRPWGLSVRDITVPRPGCQLDQEVSGTWKPYPASNNRERSIVPEDGLAFLIHACTHANVELCDFMRKINATLYSGRLFDINALVNFLKKTKQAMFAWRNNIHLSLRVDLLDQTRVYVPAVLQLHMQFYAVLISLYRPYLSTNLARRASSLAAPEDQALVQSAVSDCVAAAHQTAEFLRCYQRQHSLTRLNIQIVHLIFTASLVFVFDVCSRTYAESKTSLRNLQFCCHSLGEIGHCYGNATRALEVVILVKSEWQRLVMAQQQARRSTAKRGSVSIPCDEVSSSKRQHRPSFVSDTMGNGGVVGGAFADPRSNSTFTPPSFSAFQLLCDRYAGQPAPPTAGIAAGQPALMSESGLLMGDGTLNDEVETAQMDWLGDDQFAAMVQSINESEIA